MEKSGQVDIIVKRKDLSKTIGTLLNILLKKDSSTSVEDNESSDQISNIQEAS
jgi:acetyl-CoA carboxylase beta subunit